MPCTRRQMLQAAAMGSAGWLGLPLPGQSQTLEESQAELSRHRLARFDMHRLRDRFPRRVGANAHGSVQNYGGSFRVRRVTTDQGAQGWSMSYQDPDVFEPFVGARVSELFDLATGIREEARPLDRILHDLVGHILRQPVWQLLGAKGPRDVPIYSGSIYFDDLLPQNGERGVQAVVDACQQDHAAGYRAFKLKIGRGRKMLPRDEGLQRDIEVVRAVRTTLPDSRILVDANDSYALEETLRFVEATKDCELYWFEEPFEENADDLRRLKDAFDRWELPTRIADGEARRESRHRQGLPPGPYGDYTDAFVEHLLQLTEQGLVDVLLLDLDIVGYSRWRQIMPEFARLGVPVSPHTWAWTPRPFYAAHLASGLGNVEIVEGIPGQAEGIDYTAFEIKGGLLHLPGTPGFSLRLTK